jgi:hypothetical protein
MTPPEPLSPLNQRGGLSSPMGMKLLHMRALQRERGMIAVVNHGVDRYDRLGKGRDFELSDHLPPEQRRAVEAVLGSREHAINVRDAAGTGKTAALRETDRGLREAGHEVLAVAPTRSSVDEQGKVGFQDSMTVSRLLEDQEPPPRLRQ